MLTGLFIFRPTENETDWRFQDGLARLQTYNLSDPNALESWHDSESPGDGSRACMEESDNIAS